jgi:hypothetical protein
MSTLRVDNFAPSGGGTSFSTSGIAKAWSNFTPTTPSLDQDLNITSLTDNGVGDFSLNFTNNMTTTTYVATYSTEALSAGSTSQPRFDSQTTALTRGLFFNFSNVLFDSGGAHNSVFGNLA